MKKLLIGTKGLSLTPVGVADDRQRNRGRIDAEVALDSSGNIHCTSAYLCLRRRARLKSDELWRSKLDEFRRWALGTVRGLHASSHQDLAELLLLWRSTLNRHLEGPDIVLEADIADGLRAAEASVFPVVEEVRKDEAPWACRLGSGAEVLQQGLEFPEAAVLRDLEVMPERRHLGVALRHHGDGDAVRQRRQRQRQVHHGVELEGLLQDIREIDLRANLELENVHDARLVPPKIAQPGLLRHQHICLTSRARIFHKRSGIVRHVDILVETIQEEREQFLGILLLVAIEVGTFFAYELLELRRR
mmetsp:Transcript_13604/g.29974  ORF Transcript_13604/g.29974 Transcript_13604/m.29974 type:complete len:304 (+) Transcript_13604:727-1638(+)